MKKNSEEIANDEYIELAKDIIEDESLSVKEKVYLIKELFKDNG